METKQIITYVGIAAVAYYIYTQYIAPVTAAVAAAPGTTPASPTAPVSPTSPSPAAPTQTTVTQASGTAYVPSIPSAPITRVPPINATLDSTFGSADFGSSGWVNRVAAAMTAAAGTQPQNADNWSWYYQNSAGGSAIAPSVFQAVLDRLGGDRSQTMGVTMFLNALVATMNDPTRLLVATGVSQKGTNLAGLGLGSFWGWVN